MTHQLFLVLLLASVAAVDEKEIYDGYKVYTLTFNSTEQSDDFIAEITKYSGVEFWNATNVMVSPDMQDTFLEQLEIRGIKWEISIDNVQSLVNDAEAAQAMEQGMVAEEIGPFDKYQRYEEIQKFLAEMVADHPDKASVSSIGTSYEGRNLPVIKISTGGNGTRPAILIDGGIHAREWIAVAMSLYTVDQLLQNESNIDLIDKVDWHIIPIINPDGYEFSFTTFRLWRKTRSETVSCDQLAALAPGTNNGVDANRNFDFHWNESDKLTNPCDEMYPGPEPFSEPEVASLRDYVMAPAANIKLYLTFHSFGRMILYPWGYTAQNAPDKLQLHDLASKANEAQRAVSGHMYYVGSHAQILYKATGSSIDWMKGEAGVEWSFLVQLPGGGPLGFNMPPSNILPTVEGFWPAVRVFGEHVASQ